MFTIISLLFWFLKIPFWDFHCLPSMLKIWQPLHFNSLNKNLSLHLFSMPVRYVSVVDENRPWPHLKERVDPHAVKCSGFIQSPAGPLGSVHTQPELHLWKHRLPSQTGEAGSGARAWGLQATGNSHAPRWAAGWPSPKLRKLSKGRKKGSERNIVSQNEEDSLSKPVCEFSVYFSSQSPQEGHEQGPEKVIHMYVDIKSGWWSPNTHVDRCVYRRGFSVYIYPCTYVYVWFLTSVQIKPFKCSEENAV